MPAVSAPLGAVLGLLGGKSQTLPPEPPPDIKIEATTDAAIAAVMDERKTQTYMKMMRRAQRMWWSFILGLAFLLIIVVDVDSATTDLVVTTVGTIVGYLFSSSQKSDTFR